MHVRRRYIIVENSRYTQLFVSFLRGGRAIPRPGLGRGDGHGTRGRVCYDDSTVRRAARRDALRGHGGRGGGEYRRETRPETLVDRRKRIKDNDGENNGGRLGVRARAFVGDRRGDERRGPDWKLGYNTHTRSIGYKMYNVYPYGVGTSHAYTV